jgi:hypothetical protein
MERSALKGCSRWIDAGRGDFARRTTAAAQAKNSDRRYQASTWKVMPEFWHYFTDCTPLVLRCILRARQVWLSCHIMTNTRQHPYHKLSTCGRTGNHASPSLSLGIPLGPSHCQNALLYSD